MPAPPPKTVSKKRMINSTLQFLPNLFPNSSIPNATASIPSSETGVTWDNEADVAITSKKKQRITLPISQAVVPDSDGTSDTYIWHAPEDQDGSGITKLNAKFEGRY